MKLNNVQWIGLLGVAFASAAAAQPVPGGWGGRFVIRNIGPTGAPRIAAPDWWRSLRMDGW